jgi:hypothetical protein
MLIVKFYYVCVLQDTQNVIGVMVLNNEGFPVKSNLDNTTTVQVTKKEKYTPRY